MSIKTVLIIDNEAPVLDVLCKMVEQDGFDVVCAENAAEAMVLMDSASPFMVLTDLSLANHIDGSTLAAHLHSIDPLCIFVATTGYLDVFQLGYLLGTVFTDVLQKPIEQETLTEVLQYGWKKRCRWEGIYDGITRRGRGNYDGHPEKHSRSTDQNGEAGEQHGAPGEGVRCVCKSTEHS